MLILLSSTVILLVTGNVLLKLPQNYQKSSLMLLKFINELEIRDAHVFLHR